MSVRVSVSNSMRKNLSDTPKTIDDLYKSFEQLRREQELDPEWQKNNLEWELRNTQWIVDKAKASQVYAQNLYAAMCNNQFIQLDAWQILKEEYWSCSWRYAGGIIADMLDEGDYMDWYCSGKGGPMGGMEAHGYLQEGTVSKEVEEDLKILGWLVVPYND